jgi:HAD superfamily hydrolase (TIGR01509 family)
VTPSVHPPARLKAAILDMDGLLIDSEPMWREAEAAVFAALGTQLSEAEMLSTMGRRVLEVVEHWRRERPWPGAETGDPDDPTIAGRIVDLMVAGVAARGRPMPGVQEAVGLLRRSGLAIAIASSSPPRLIDAACARLGLEWIQVRCSALDEVSGKPAPDVYLTASRRLGLDPGACLAVEDSPNGVLAARAAGMRCVAVPDPHLAGDERYRVADRVLGSLAELDVALLRELGWEGQEPQR